MAEEKEPRKWELEVLGQTEDAEKPSSECNPHKGQGVILEG
jgi:hypothetical protein